MARRVTRKPKHQDLFEHAKKVYNRDVIRIQAWSLESDENGARTSSWSSFYWDAREWCWDVADNAGAQLETVAKVLAATSPLKSWGQNKAIAKRIIEGAPVIAQPLTTNRKLLVDKILLDPTMPFPESGIKTWNFYHNIVDPWLPNVTIDRHMIRPVLGRVSCSRLEYDAIADAVRWVARRQYCAPSSIQASLWGWYRTDGGRKPDRL